jgi:hypothetical protein
VTPTDPELPVVELRSVFGTDAQGSRVTVERVYEPVASASSGIWRVRMGERSAILKLVAHSNVGHPNWRSGQGRSHWYYWRREVLAYETGLLGSLTGGLRAPICHLVSSRDDDSVALWLEDLHSASATLWPLERYGSAARHLGQMQGAFLDADHLGDHDWLSHDWLRSYLRQRDGDLHLVDRTDIWNDPRLASWFPDPPIARLEAMRRDQSVFLDALDGLPRTLCHLDLHPANLFGDDVGSTTAVDWAFVGVGAIGEDAGNLVPDAVLDFHVDPARIDDLYAIVADGYAAGLRDVGWRGPDSRVRLGMASTIAAKYAWIGPAILRAVSENGEHLNRRPIDESLSWWVPTVRFLLDRADEARGLAAGR